MAAKNLTYKDAGVDIDSANLFIEKIKPLAKKTHRPEVLSGIGHYAGLFSLDVSKYRQPVLVSSTDGVGTKLKLGIEYGCLEGLGQDLVAMSANDVLCLGAEPLFFLDYFATGKLNVKDATKIVSGIADACQKIGCTLLGGETAEMPKLYRGNDFDLAGFLVGVVERDEVIDGSKIAPGDQVIGIASSGFHSNGYSLVQKIVAKKKLSLTRKHPPLSQPLGDLLMEPTRLYGPVVLSLMKQHSLHGIAHITGGGLLENLPRILPEHCRFVIRSASWPRPPLFSLFQKLGGIQEEEMYRVFNCGIGLVLIVPANEAESIKRELIQRGETSWIIGEVVGRRDGDNVINIL